MSLLLCSLPVLSIVGTYFANVTGNTSILLLTLVAILAVFVVAAFSKRLANSKLYLIIVFVIAISLLFQYSLTSNYIQGPDIKTEINLATLTQSQGFWNSTASFTNLQFGKLDNMLSVTILPTIFSNIFGMDITWIFKIVYPLLFALVPVALYVLFRGKFGATMAFLSVFLLMSQNTFYTEMLALARQMIGELFLVLLFFVLFSKTLRPRNAKILFGIFSFGVIVSHYSIAILCAFLLLLIWLLGPQFTKKPIMHLSLSMVAVFFAFMFSWYTFISSSAVYTSIITQLSTVLNGLGSFFNPASRGTTVLEGLGLTAAPSTLSSVSRGIAYATEFFIIIGFFVLLLQLRKKDFDSDYFIPCLGCITILVMCILLPNFADTFNMTRFYHTLLLFVAPLFVIGCVELFRFAGKLFGVAAKRKTEIYSLILMVLVLGAYFLFQTNLIYEVADSPNFTLPLSRYQLGSALYSQFDYITGPQVSGAEWLTQNTNESNLVVYADSTMYYTLVSYGEIYVSHIVFLSNTQSLQQGQFMYLGELNTVYGEIAYNGGLYNVSDALASQPLAVTYNNGFCEILTSTIASP
jgi:uncharacterized membrane protein